MNSRGPSTLRAADTGYVALQFGRYATLFLVSLLACGRKAPPLPSELGSIQFGMFFGGQVQQRLELPKPLTPAQNNQGLRLEFRRPLSSPIQVTWYLDHPTARSGPRGPSNVARAIRSSSAVLPAGIDRFDQAVSLEPTDPPGTYNLRVLLGNELVLDRSFRIVPGRLDDNE